MLKRDGTTCSNIVKFFRVIKGGYIIIQGGLKSSLWEWIIYIYIHVFVCVSITYDSQASDDYHDIIHILIDTLPAHSWVLGVSTILCSQALDEPYEQWESLVYLNGEWLDVDQRTNPIKTCVEKRLDHCSKFINQSRHNNEHHFKNILLWPQKLH